MAARVVCGACGKRLKLPDGPVEGRSAKCPRCRARVDLPPAPDASAYLPTVAAPTAPPPAHTKPHPRPVPAPRAARPEPLSLDDEPLSLDDGPPEVPFRVPARVLADSARQFVGPCFAVVVPHGVFLEVEPLRPFLYVPIGCPTDAAAPGELTATLPDGRAVTVRIKARYARPLARDLLSFLSGARAAPVAADYRRPWWLLWLAPVLAIGTATGPLVLTRTANVELESGLKAGAAFALVALVANVAVVLLSRLPALGQVFLMAASCTVVTGAFFFGATAYFAGRQKALQETQTPTAGAEPPAAPNPPSNPNPQPPAPPPPGPGPRPPSHIDKAYLNGVSALEDGPADVTALAITADGAHLGIGFADGTTRMWPLDQPTFDTTLPGPKVDGPVGRMQFDDGGKFLFATGPTGVVAAPRGGSPAAPAKLNGPFVAIAPELSGDRVRFAAVRGNLVAHRLLPTAFILNPPTKAKGFAVPAPRDEVTPADVKTDPRAANVTFLAWTPANKLLAGAPDGSVSVSDARMRPEAANRDHKAPARAWAACSTTGDFATGDDKGNVVVWPYRGGKPTLVPVFTTPVVGLSFAPSGEWLAATDSTGWLAIVEVPTLKVIQRKRLPLPVKALAFGPNNDVMILGNGKTTEVWWLPELMK